MTIGCTIYLDIYLLNNLTNHDTIKTKINIENQKNLNL